MPIRDLPARASLENLRKQAKALHRGFQSGDAEAVVRIRTNLPRINELPEAEVASAELSRQEAQHVLAREYGYRTWEAICTAASAGFDDLGLLTDGEAQVLLREVSQKDLSRALVGSTEPVSERFLSNMSQRVRGFLQEEAQRYADLDEAEIEASRQRVVEVARTLAADGRIGWPPQERAPVTPRPTADRPEDPLEGARLEDVSIDDLGDLLGSLAAEAQRNGILSIEGYADVLPSMLGEGLRLAVDGTQSRLIGDILVTRSETTARNRRIRLQQMLEGVLSMQAGDNPWIVHHKQQVYFLDAGDYQGADRINEDITPAQFDAWLLRTPVRSMRHAELADLFLHLAFLARREGIEALAPVAEKVDDPFLRDGLRMAAARRAPGEVRAELLPRMRTEVSALLGRLRAVRAGVLAIADGKAPEEVAAAARAAYAEVVD